MISNIFTKLTLMTIFLLLFSGCGLCNWCNESYSNCQDNFTVAKESLRTCEKNLDKEEKSNGKLTTLTNQLKNNETYVIQNANFDKINNRYMQENYIFNFTYQQVINFIFMIQITITLGIPIAFVFGRNKIVIGSLTVGSVAVSFIIGTLI